MKVQAIPMCKETPSNIIPGGCCAMGSKGKDRNNDGVLAGGSWILFPKGKEEINKEKAFTAHSNWRWDSNKDTHEFQMLSPRWHLNTEAESTPSPSQDLSVSEKEYIKLFRVFSVEDEVSSRPLCWSLDTFKRKHQNSWLCLISIPEWMDEGPPDLQEWNSAFPYTTGLLERCW